MMRAACLAIVLAACGDPPPLTIKYELTSGADQACMDSMMQPAKSCTDVAMPCQMYLSVRVVAPSDPTQAFITLCKPVTGQKDLCSIAGLDLPQARIPAQTLQVQVALYPEDALTDVDGDGALDCPTDLQFAATGLPVSAVPFGGQPLPAVGGSAYYHPGDPETDVALGCTSQDELAWCQADNAIDVTAAIDDFDLLEDGLPSPSVTEALGDQLRVSVGEPFQSINPDEYVLNPASAQDLMRTVEGPEPAWGEPVMLTFQQAACLEVLEDSAQTTPTLTCKPVTPDQRAIDFTGVWLSRTTLQQVLATVGQPDVPTRGLVLGIVLDDTGQPKPGVTVLATSSDPMHVPAPDLEYLSPDLTKQVTGGTSSSGVFVSQDAPFGTIFTAQDGSTPTPPVAYGGVVDGKVTLVVLQYTKPQGS